MSGKRDIFFEPGVVGVDDDFDDHPPRLEDFDEEVEPSFEDDEDDKEDEDGDEDDEETEDEDEDGDDSSDDEDDDDDDDDNEHEPELRFSQNRFPTRRHDHHDPMDIDVIRTPWHGGG